MSVVLSLRFFIHYSGHFLFPWAVAYFFYRESWRRVGLIFMTSMLVDLDHLLATPIFDPNRLSLGFHPLHSYPAILIYFAMIFTPRLRLWGLALLTHMATDLVDYSLA